MVECLLGADSAQLTDFALVNAPITGISVLIVLSIWIYYIYKVSCLSEHRMGVNWQGEGKVEFRTFSLPRTFKQDQRRFTWALLRDKIRIEYYY